MKSIQQHENCAERNYAAQNQLIFPLFHINALNERIDTWKCAGDVVKATLKTFEGFPLSFQVLLGFDCNGYLVVDQVVGAKIIGNFILMLKFYCVLMQLQFSPGQMLALLGEHVTTAQGRRSWRCHESTSPEQFFTLDLYRMILCDFVEFGAIRVKNIPVSGESVNHRCARCGKTCHMLIELGEFTQHVFNFHRNCLIAEFTAVKQRRRIGWWEWSRWAADFTQCDELHVDIELEISRLLTDV